MLDIFFEKKQVGTTADTYLSVNGIIEKNPPATYTGNQLSSIEVKNEQIFQVLISASFEDVGNFIPAFSRKIMLEEFSFTFRFVCERHGRVPARAITVSISTQKEDWKNSYSYREFLKMLSVVIKDDDIPGIEYRDYSSTSGGAVTFYSDIKNNSIKERFDYSFYKITEYTKRVKAILQEIADVSDNIIERSLEFAPEYYQAGLGILNYFGTYLREKYPDEKAKVKIIQEGLQVRMIIETLDGKSEVIEKALHEYQLIVTGQKRPEDFTNNPELILGLRSEVRIAQVRIADQQDIIALQNAQIQDQVVQIKELYSIISNGLINRAPNIDFKPTINVHTSIQFNQNISSALGSIAELKDLLPPGGEAHTTLKEIEGSLEAIEKEKDPEKVKKSPAMSKFKRFIEKVTEGNNDVRKAIDAAEQGWDIFKDLAGKYNSIAEWCALPQVPKMFTK